MKNSIKSIWALSLIVLLGLSACKKEAPSIFDMFEVNLTFHNTGLGTADEYVEATPGQELVVDFTIESPKGDMYQIAVLKVGSNTPFIRMPITDDSKRRVYTGTINIIADAAGESSYRIWAVDKDGIYLGDGYKKLTVYVAPDFTFLPNRTLFFPDSVNTQLNSFVSLTDGQVYSFANGAATSAKIDFGIYRKPTISGGAITGYTNHLYSIAASPNPFTPYDVSAWTPRGTLFAAPLNSNANNFRNMFKTGAAIETEAKKRNINLTHISSNIAVNQFIYFLTPEGKYGVIFVNAFTESYDGKPFMNISIKMIN